MNVYDKIPYDGPVCPETDLPLVPKYGPTQYDEGGFEVYPILDYVRVSEDLSMPPLAQQWRYEWQDRVERAHLAGFTICAPPLRAPKQFIETGVWPKDEPRPLRPYIPSREARG